MNELALLFKRLSDCLILQEETVDRLLAAGRLQQQALRENNLVELISSIQKQEACTVEMENIEKERLSLLNSLGEELNIEPGMSLSQLIPFAKSPVREALQRSLSALQEKVTLVQQINSLNRVFIKKAQMINVRLMKLLVPDNANTYGIKGEVQSSSNQSALINKSV